MNDIHVGNIIYVAFDKKAQILPALVVEKIVREKPNAKEISFGLQFSNRTQVEVVKFSENMFANLESARKKLIERLTKNIELFCNRAKDAEKKLLLFRNEIFQEISPEIPGSIDPDLETQGDDQEAYLVDLPEGGKGRVTIPKMP